MNKEIMEELTNLSSIENEDARTFELTKWMESALDKIREEGRAEALEFIEGIRLQEQQRIKKLVEEMKLLPEPQEGEINLLYENGYQSALEELLKKI